MTCWQLGNTTVRSALRIREGLIAYAESDLQGAIRGSEGDIAFRNLLGSAGLVSLGEDKTNSLGRKWRSAMGKLGFLYPEVHKNWGFSQDELGPLDYITPAGRALIRAKTMPAIYEVYLRSMAVPVQRTDSGEFFSALRWVLAVLFTVEEESSKGAYLSFHEMAAFVQTTNPMWDRREIAHYVISSREERKRAVSAKAFHADLLAEAEERSGVKAATLKDYADENIRYLKATGLFEAAGHGIRLVEEKRFVARSLSDAIALEDLSLKYLLTQLCRGADLPTDNYAVANGALDDVLETVRRMGLTFSLSGRELDTPAQINAARYEIEELISQEKEIAYAARQEGEYEEIAGYLELLSTGKKKGVLSDGRSISLPKEERPAYFEWALWRSILAIDGLKNHPYQVRRFKIDADFKPVCTAPGGGPDLVAEFADFVLAIEVTMSTGSRQEAMEGEPVRRHVADLAIEYDKPVMGLFVAVRVNLNTIETFRHGVWYTKDEQLLDLGIVPLELSQYRNFFIGLFENSTKRAAAVRVMLEDCLRAKEGLSAPEWRCAIAEALG